MLSDAGIKDYICKGLLKVEPQGKIGPASIDLHIGGELYRSNTEAHYTFERDINFLHLLGLHREAFQRQEDVSRLPFDAYVSRFGIKVPPNNDFWTLEPGVYYTRTAESITTASGVGFKIASRSSTARNGIRIQHSDDGIDKGRSFSGRPFLVLEAYAPVEVPQNYPLCQMVVQPSVPLAEREIIEALQNGEMDASHIGLNNDALLLTWHPRLLVHNDRPLNSTKDTNGCFDEVDITNGYWLQPGRFYLGSTREVVRIGHNYVGDLKEIYNYTHTHMNAPYVWPGHNDTITLEVQTSQPRRISAADSACMLRIERVYPQCTSPYNESYNGRQGPVVARIL